ncbi:MAG: DUF1152 domain-containing protein [Bacteroidota bacterium]
MEIPIKQELSDSKKILLCGAGGGYDIYSGIPLYFYLSALDKEVYLANYSFSAVQASQSRRIGPSGYIIDKDSRDMSYFPEKFMVDWMEKLGIANQVFAFAKTGVRPLRESLDAIIKENEIDTLIMVDGGTDSLMRGNEAGLGTPTEDATSIVAAHGIELKKKYLAAIGFGVDHFHGVCHAQFLENVANQIEFGGYKGCCSVQKEEMEGQYFLELVKYANQRASHHMSIVANSIASAIEGRFGDYHATNRTAGSRLFINPLMSLYWFFDLDKIAHKLQYLSMIEHTETESEVIEGIRTFRKVIKHKAWVDMPY